MRSEPARRGSRLAVASRLELERERKRQNLHDARRVGHRAHPAARVQLRLGERGRGVAPGRADGRIRAAGHGTRARPCGWLDQRLDRGRVRGGDHREEPQRALGVALGIFLVVVGVGIDSARRDRFRGWILGRVRGRAAPREHVQAARVRAEHDVRLVGVQA
jgi:hypothetical protein